MTLYNGIVNSSTNGSISWTTPLPVILKEEEDTILTIIVVILGAIIAIVVLCSMGIFIDSLHQHNKPLNKKAVRIKVPLFSRRRYNNDGRSLASNMYSTDISNIQTANTAVMIV